MSEPKGRGAGWTEDLSEPRARLRLDRGPERAEGARRRLD